MSSIVTRTPDMFHKPMAEHCGKTCNAIDMELEVEIALLCKYLFKHLCCF